VFCGTHRRQPALHRSKIAGSECGGERTHRLIDEARAKFEFPIHRTEAAAILRGSFRLEFVGDLVDQRGLLPGSFDPCPDRLWVRHRRTLRGRRVNRSQIVGRPGGRRSHRQCREPGDHHANHAFAVHVVPCE